MQECHCLYLLLQGLLIQLPQQLQQQLHGMLHPKVHLQAPKVQLVGLQELPLQGHQHPQVQLHSCFTSCLYVMCTIVLLSHC